MLQNDGPPEPWRSFFDDLDEMLREPTELHCCGGFIVIYSYGVARTTNDVDFISLVPNQLRERLSELGGRGSALFEKYKVYLDPVTVTSPPDGYESRLKPLFPGVWRFLKLYALEAHDLALTKLERNYERDREDVQRLARAGHLDRETLSSRYRQELRPYLSRETWHDQTLQMWIESCWPGTRD
jgi:hypothetical protein